MTHKRKALLLSVGYGMGHHSAARALAEELERRGWSARMVDACAEASPRAFRLTQAMYAACVRYAPWVWGAIFEQLDAINWARMLRAPGIARSMEWLRRHLQQEKPQLVVCTYPLFAYMLDAFKREGWFTAPYAVVVTDAIAISKPWLLSDAPLICLPDAHSLALVQERFCLPGDRIAAPGFPVRGAFSPGVQRSAPGAHGDGLHLIYGAFAPLPRVLEDLHSLLAAWPRVQIRLLAGDRADRLRAHFGEQPQITICERGTDLAPLFRTAHFYIGKAGAATTFEAYSAELPVIVNYALPGQEEGNLELMMQDGAGRYAESSGALVQLLGRLLSHDAAGWRRMCHAMHTACRGGGAKRIADLLERRFFS